MKKLVALLLVVAFLFGFGFTVAEFSAQSSPAMAGPGDNPPPVWPPFGENSIIIRI